MGINYKYQIYCHLNEVEERGRAYYMYVFMKSTPMFHHLTKLS